MSQFRDCCGKQASSGLNKICAANDNSRVVDVRRLAETGGVMNSGSMADREGSEANRCELCPLSRVQTGVAVRIRQLCATPEMQCRLREIGLCEDQVVRLITNRSSFICQVCNSRLALSEQLASLIMVEPMRPAMARAGR